MRTIILGLCFFISFLAKAQRECATQAYLDAQLASHAGISKKQADIESFIQRQKITTRLNGDEGSSVTGVIKIPVVVHILYNTASENIPDAQVFNQLAALNRDFRRLNNDTLNTPDPFKSLAADVQIEFVLATADEEGRPTTGIVRKHTYVTYWKTDDQIKFSSEGGSNAWDSRFYLNIWVGNLQSVIGYSSSPGGDVTKDGVVISTSVFGSVKSGNYNLGRTTVHEVGHWLGLKHIWGDQYCGDDLVDDTPRQGNFTPGCPTGFRSSCSNGTTGDMYMNFMDYTADACMNLFTEGQKERMRILFIQEGPRHSILASKGLWQPWKEPLPEAVELPAQVTIYPNPAQSDLTINLDETWVGKTIHILNSNGAVIITFRVNSKIQKIDVQRLKPGLYYLHGTKANGKLLQKFIKL